MKCTDSNNINRLKAIGQNTFNLMGGYFKKRIIRHVAKIKYKIKKEQIDLKEKRSPSEMHGILKVMYFAACKRSYETKELIYLFI